MSKAGPEVLARVALAARLLGGFHNPRETVRSSACAGDGVRRIKTAGTEAHDLGGLPKLAPPRGHGVGDDGGDAGRAHERARTRRPVWRRDAEALVREQHDADVR